MSSIAFNEGNVVRIPPKGHFYYRAINRPTPSRWSWFTSADSFVQPRPVAKLKQEKKIYWRPDFESGSDSGDTKMVGNGRIVTGF